MLVEVIIVTVVVATIMISLYVAFNKVYTAYEEKNNYTNIDGIYALKLITDDYINKLEFNDLLNNTTSYSEITNPEDESYIASVFKEYRINKVYLVNSSKINDLIKSKEINPTFIDYIDYLTKKRIIRHNNYVLLVEITIDSKNKVYNYAYLEI